MTPQRSAFARRAAALAVAATALLAAVLPAWSAPVTPVATLAPEPANQPALTASLIASAPTVPTGGTFGYVAEVRLTEPASYLQAVLEVFRPSGQLLFKRTRVANGVKPGIQRFSFERELADVLELDPDSYPVRLSVGANIGPSVVTTEATTTLRVYAKDGPRLRVAVVARVTGTPMSAPDGRFAVDPTKATGARNAIGTISRRVLSDPNARVTLAVPPVLLAEWRRLSGGYSLTDGTTVRPTDPVPAAYNSTLADLKAAIDTKRLELVVLGYSDPNLTDLASNGLARDVGPQYDAGVSAVFQSLEVTPSVGTAPAGGCIPPAAPGLLGKKDVRYVVVDSDCARIGKNRAESGVYPIADEKLRALVTEVGVSKSLSLGAPTPAVERAFARLMHSAREPIVLGVEIDGDAFVATDSVGAALSAFEAQPWALLATAGSLKAPSGASKVRLLAGRSTPKAPKGFWGTIAKSRSYADGYFAALGASDPAATTATMQSLVAEGSAWAGADGAWSESSRGIEYAQASLRTTKPILDGISIHVEPITLSGSSGEVPITIVNATDKTLNAVVTVTSSGGVRVGDTSSFPTTLLPQETYLQVPVDMATSLSGKLTVEVHAGDLSLARKTVTVSASYLDRLVLGGAVVVALLGMLVFIVRRSRAAQPPGGDSGRRGRYTVADDDDLRRSSR